MNYLARRNYLLFAVLLCGTAFAHADDSKLRTTAEQAYTELQRQVADSSLTTAERAAAAARISTLDEHPDILTKLRKTDASLADALDGENLLRTYRFSEAKTRIDALAGKSDPVARMLRYRWLFVTENLSAADTLTLSETTKDSTDFVAAWARGELLFRLLRQDEAAANLERALRHATTPRQEADAKLGLAKVYDKRNEHQRAFDSLATLITPQMLTSDILYQTGLVLINLSRVSEAIDMIEEAVHWNPNSEFAHYFLGNGYARLNYTQLHDKYPDAYANAEVLKALAPALTAFENGDIKTAKSVAQSLTAKYPKAVEPPAFWGSLEWDDAHADSAESLFRRALARCPEYGRAHNGLAKSLELKRMRVNVHRSEDSLKFADTAMPNVPRIEEFVADWKSLSPRHQKQVALAISPWKLYIPVLVESGHRYYIKPLHEKLSESPGLETMKDQRINYDSRLWDDVRGCGGYTTVTGIEDVERSIYSNYNTVLHELTHQVHGVYPPEDWQRIDAAYHSARNREDKGEKVFMSQYQASSVWEYFAEGANGYYSPRRDAYDTREIVRERLLSMDSTLQHLIEYYVTAPNLDACYPVGLVDAAQDATERNELSQAMTYAQKAYARAPHGEVVLAELSHLYSVSNEDKKALAFADSLRRYVPHKAGGYTQWQSAKFFADGSTHDGIMRLREGLAAVNDTSEDKQTLQQALGQTLWYAGDYAGAAEEFRAILERHTGDSDALWGLGEALGDAGKFADSDSAFQKALHERNGIAQLRLDYARMLLNGGRTADAETQIHEAALLTPDDPPVVTMQGWLAAAKGDWTAALSLYDKSLKDAPYDRLAAVLKIDALTHSGQGKKAASEWRQLEKKRQKDVPAWIYAERQSSWVTGYAWPKCLHVRFELIQESRAKSKQT